MRDKILIISKPSAVGQSESVQMFRDMVLQSIERLPTKEDLEVVIIADVDENTVREMRHAQTTGEAHNVVLPSVTLTTVKRSSQRRFTIGHVDHGKTTLTQTLLMAQALQKAHDKEPPESMTMFIRNHHQDLHPEPCVNPHFEGPTSPWAKRKKGKFKKWT